MQLLMLGPSKQPEGVRYTGCFSQSSLQGWAQSSGWYQFCNIQAGVLWEKCQVHVYLRQPPWHRLTGNTAWSRVPSIPSAFVLTACSREDDQDPSLQDTVHSRVRQVCRHLAPTVCRQVTRGNLDASCKIPEVALNLGTVLWTQLPYSPRKSVTREFAF